MARSSLPDSSAVFIAVAVIFTMTPNVVVVVNGVTMVTRTSYTAAVYEHVIISPVDAEATFTRRGAYEWMSRNLDVFEQQTAIAAQKGADIIVFPEYGVTGFDHSRDSMVPFLEDVPDPDVDWAPCSDPDRFPDTLVLRRLSCLASNHSIYIVANVGDIKACPYTDVSCPVDGRYQFNTNVVFDSEGKLIARYHKFNLYDESPLFDAAPSPEYVAFDTPFGRFGTVVCFDLMHRYPTQVLLADFNVDNLLVTSAWNVFYPFVISTQMYSGISMNNRVNLIASNARNEDYIMASSGIFGSGVSVLSDPAYDSDQGVLLMAELSSDAYNDDNDNNLDGSEITPLYNSVAEFPYINTTYNGTYEYGMNMSFVVLKESSSSAIVCGEYVCCAVRYEIGKVVNGEMFVIGASDFPMPYPGIAHLQFCAVHRCTSRDLATCGEGVKSAQTTFKYIKLQAFFDHDLVFPIVATTPYNNITLNTEKDNYSFDKQKAIFESSSLDRPLLAAVVLNSIYEGNYSYIDFTDVQFGGSTQQGTRMNASPTLHMFALAMVIFSNCKLF